VEFFRLENGRSLDVSENPLTKKFLYDTINIVINQFKMERAKKKQI